MLREDLKLKDSGASAEKDVPSAVNATEGGSGEDIHASLAENAGKVINVSASYAYLSALTRDCSLLPPELAALQENVQRYVAALAADPISALAAPAGTDDMTCVSLIRDLTASDAELTELLSNTLTGRFHVVKSYAASDEFFSLCTTLPRIFRENNAPGAALMHYLCALIANILTAENITPALVKRLEKLRISVPSHALTVKGRVVFSRLFVAAVEFIMAHQPHVLYLVSRNKAALYQAAREQELRNFIRDAVDEIPEDTGNMGLFETDGKYQDEESEAIARRVDNLIRRAASIARSANLIKGDGNGEIVEADLPGKGEAFDAGTLTEEEIARFFMENPHAGMSGLYDEELLSRYDFSRSRADAVTRNVLFPESPDGTGSSGKDGSVQQNTAGAEALRGGNVETPLPQMDIDLIGEFNSFKEQCEKLSGNARERTAEVPQNVNLSRRVNELIQKVANDVEYINSLNPVSLAGESGELKSEVSDAALSSGKYVKGDEDAGKEPAAAEETSAGNGMVLGSDGLDIFSDEESLSAAIARENTENSDDGAADGGTETTGPEDAGSPSSDAMDAASETEDDNDVDDRFMENLEEEQNILLRLAETVRNDVVTVYPDPVAEASGNTLTEDAGAESLNTESYASAASDHAEKLSAPDEAAGNDAVNEAGDDMESGYADSEGSQSGFLNVSEREESEMFSVSGEVQDDANSELPLNEIESEMLSAEDNASSAESAADALSDTGFLSESEKHAEHDYESAERTAVKTISIGSTGRYSWVSGFRTSGDDSVSDTPKTERFVDENEVISVDTGEFTGSDEVISIDENQVITDTVTGIVDMPDGSDGETDRTEDIHVDSAFEKDVSPDRFRTDTDVQEEFSPASPSAEEMNDGGKDNDAHESSDHEKHSEGFFSRFRKLFGSSSRAREKRRSDRDFNEVNHRSVPMDHIVNSLNELIESGNASEGIINIAKGMRKALTEPLKDSDDVLEWLGFVGNPLTTAGRRGRIIQQWTVMLLSLKFRLMGRDVSGFSSAKPYGDLDVKGDCRWVDESIFLTLQQIERMQLLSGFTDELGLPAFLPLPPLYAHGREGGINVSHTEGENGRVWKVNFFFELENLGAVQILTELNGEDVSISVVSEKFEALRRINDTSDSLKNGIERHGLRVVSINSRMGTVYPPSV